MEAPKNSMEQTPEDRDAWASRQKELVIKEAAMLQAGGEYHVDEQGAVSYKFSDKQLNERGEMVKSQQIRQFYEENVKEFESGVNLGPEEMRIFTEMVQEDPRYVEVAKKEGGKWIITPTKKAIEEIPLRFPCKIVPAEQLLDKNERSEYPPLSVDYSLSFNQTLEHASRLFANDRVHKFPLEKFGEKVIVPELVRLGRELNWNQALIEIDKMGLRSATYRELLAFAITYPNDPNWKHVMVVPGVQAMIELCLLTPCISGDSSDDEQKLYIYKALSDIRVLNNHKDFSSKYIALCVKKEKNI